MNQAHKTMHLAVLNGENPDRPAHLLPLVQNFRLFVVFLCSGFRSQSSTLLSFITVFLITV